VLPLIVILAIIAVVLMVIGSIVLWLLGLIIAFVFFVVGVMLLYALHETEALDVQKDPWLVILPIVMFFVGLGLDKTGMLQFQPLSFSTLATNPLSWFSTEAMLFLIIIVLLIVDIYIGLTKK